MRKRNVERRDGASRHRGRSAAFRRQKRPTLPPRDLSPAPSKARRLCRLKAALRQFGGAPRNFECCEKVQRPADCKSAIQQIKNLRYASGSSGPHLRRATQLTHLTRRQANLLAIS